MPVRHVATTRETPEAERRAHARELVARDARRGIVPSEEYPADELAWCFAGHEEALAELEEIATQAPVAEAQREDTIARRRQLQQATDRVLAEWDAQRRRDAEAEARKRLGWEEGERP